MQFSFTKFLRIALPLAAFSPLVFAESFQAIQLSKLDYPTFPKELFSPSIPGLMKEQNLDRSWALVNIGFFGVFDRRDQPLPGIAVGCSPSIVVAVIDTGIDYTHPDLVKNIWTNPGETGPWEPPGSLANATLCREKNCNGIDDDGNGFVDDVAGWDFVHDFPMPYDTHGHGTHISGIIAGTAVTSEAPSGVCPAVKIMALKYYDNSGAGFSNLNNTVRAIQYAMKQGAHIINYSGGGSDPAAAEKIAIQEAKKKGILFVAAAGNEGRNNDRVPYYPASYGLENIVSVASLNRKNEILPSSNYGKSVHIAAPGMMILSTLPGGKAGLMSGTSQATAFVTGTAALLLSQFPPEPSKRPSYVQLKSWLIDGVQPLRGKENRSLIPGGVLSVPLAVALSRGRSNVGQDPKSIASHSKKPAAIK